MDGRVLLLLALTASALAGSKGHYDLSHAKALFAKFMKDYNRQYTNAAEQEIHFNAFKENLKSYNMFIEMSKSNDAIFEINNTSDYTLGELKKVVENRQGAPTVPATRL